MAQPFQRAPVNPMPSKPPDRPRYRTGARSAIPDPFADQPTAPVAAADMAEAARLSTRIAVTETRPHVVPRAVSSSPASGVLPHGELRIAGIAGILDLQVRHVTRTGVALEVPADATFSASEGVSAVVELHLGADANGQAIRARLPARVAHHRKPQGGNTGGLSLRWDTSGPGVIETIVLLLERLGPAVS